MEKSLAPIEEDVDTIKEEERVSSVQTLDTNVELSHAGKDRKSQKEQQSKDQLNLAVQRNPKLREAFKKLLERGKTIHLHDLSRAYGQPNETEEINFAQTNLSAIAIECLCPYLSMVNTSLVSLNVSHNRIEPSGLERIGHALTQNNSLTVLNLSDCQVTGNPLRPELRGIYALSKGLESNRSKIQVLSLADNFLTGPGLRVLCNTLSFHRSITSLDFSNTTSLGYDSLEGTLALASLLTFQKTPLIWLNLERNFITFRQTTRIMAGLVNHSTLTYLNLRQSFHPLQWKASQRAHFQTLVSNLSFVTLRLDE